MFDQIQMKQLIQAAEQAWYACPLQTCLIRGCPNKQDIAHQTREQKKCFEFLIECLMAFKFYQTRVWSCLIKFEGHQTFHKKLKIFLLFSCLMAMFCSFGQHVSNMFDAGMRTTLAQRLVSII